MYMHICIYICTCICTWICICIHTLIHTYAHLDAFPSLSSAIAPSKPWLFPYRGTFAAWKSQSPQVGWDLFWAHAMWMAGHWGSIQETWEPDCQTSKTGRKKFPINLERLRKWSCHEQILVCSKNSIPRYPQFPGFPIIIIISSIKMDTRKLSWSLIIILSITIPFFQLATWINHHVVGKKNSQIFRECPSNGATFPPFLIVKLTPLPWKRAKGWTCMRYEVKGELGGLVARKSRILW